MKGPNFPLFFDAFMGKKELSRKNKIIVIVITVAFLGSLIAAMHYNNMIIDDAYGQDDDTEVTILEDELAADEMSDLGLDAEDEALINEELGIEDFIESAEDAGDSGSSGGDILPEDRDNFQEIPAGNENLPSAEQSGAGLNDACLQSGFSQAQCSNYLFSDDPGGYCSTLSFAGVACPEIQDPRYSYGNPEEALQDSQEQIENTDRTIEGFENTVPDDLGGQFAQD